MTAIHVTKWVEERLSPTAIEALGKLIGCNHLHFYSDWLKVEKDCSFASNVSIRTVKSGHYLREFILLDVEFEETPLLYLDYYRYRVHTSNSPQGIRSKAVGQQGGGTFEAPYGQWTYDYESEVCRIAIHEYSSIEDQVLLWPELNELSEAVRFDAIIEFVMSDGGSVTFEPALAGTCLKVQRNSATSKPALPAGYGERISIN